MRKYKLLKDETIEKRGRTLYRIEALRKVGLVNQGDKGGFVEAEKNLSHGGTCWLFNNSCSYEDAKVVDCAYMYDHAEVSHSATLKDNAAVYGDAIITDFAEVSGYATVADVMMKEEAVARGCAIIYGNIVLRGTTVIEGGAYIMRREEWSQDD